MKIEQDLARRALRVIEGLTLEDVTTELQGGKLVQIYKYAHIGVGDCKSGTRIGARGCWRLRRRSLRWVSYQRRENDN